jgi:Helix-turn-helix domain
MLFLVTKPQHKVLAFMPGDENGVPSLGFGKGPLPLTSSSMCLIIAQMRTFEYRLYTNKEQQHLLMACLIQSRQLYNEMLQTCKEHYAHTGIFLRKYVASVARWCRRACRCAYMSALPVAM